MPSGHSMMSIVLLAFLSRFYGGEHKFICFILSGLINIMVILSRLVLGMHALNQVLVSFVIGLMTLLIE